MKYFILILLLASCNSESGKMSEAKSTPSIDTSIVSYNLEQSLDVVDSITPILDKTIAKLKHYESLKHEYEQGIQVYAYAPSNNSSQVNDLKAKLNEANKEIAQLNNELNTLRTQETATRYYPTAANRKPDTVYIEPSIITPDETSLVLSLDGKIPDNTTVYLLPYSKRVKKLMVYEPSCDQSIILKNDYKIAHEYNGVYFFNNVPPGKYLIKICTYYGNYKVITKSDGKEIVKMEVAPPVQ